MSTSSIPYSRPFTVDAPLSSLQRLVRGREGDPWWSRPGLIVTSAIAGVLMLWSLTISGYANGYYADAALAASRSWTAFFTNAADLSGYVSLDKGPLSNWMMGLSGRVFGFSSLSMLLPSALCGIAAVVLLHNLVRRTLGHRAALLAALILALSPVSVVMDRYNNPDALLALLLVASAWALVRALESGRLRHMILCGVFVGLAFNTKMLEGYLVVPALAVAFVLTGRGRLRERFGHLLAGGLAMGLVSVAWYGTMMLIPVSDRPYVGDSTNNSWFQLIFGSNGLARITGGSAAGAGAGGGFGGATGPLRLLSAGMGGQIAWLLPLALVGLLVGLWIERRGPRTDRRRAALVLFGLWAVAGYLVFSFSQGTFHSYYTSAIAPAVAALAGGGVVLLFEQARRGWGWTLLLALAILGTSVLSYMILDQTPSFVPWLRWVILISGALAALTLLMLRAGDRLSRRKLLTLALSASVVALLGGPAAYSIATVGHGQTGSSPTAGPATAEAAGFGRFRAARGASSSRAGGSQARGDGANAALVKYLRSHHDGAKYLVAANGSQTAAPIALATGDPVITIGGFMGADPAPTTAQLKSLVESGQLRYIVLGGGFGGSFVGAGGFPGAGSSAHGSSGDGSGISDRFGPSTASGSGAAGSLATAPSRSAALTARHESVQTAARTQWVESHCQTVTIAGYSSTATSARAGGAGPFAAGSASSLYLCTKSDATGS